MSRLRRWRRSTCRRRTEPARLAPRQMATPLSPYPHPRPGPLMAGGPAEPVLTGHPAAAGPAGISLPDNEPPGGERRRPDRAPCADERRERRGLARPDPVPLPPRPLPRRVAPKRRSRPRPRSRPSHLPGAPRRLGAALPPRCARPGPLLPSCAAL